ncbi:PAS domain-containing sensor histidine kinase [Paenibacillus agaridevorans]|uniref:histidine kinase n=1 Tax=Paenibacillus agaridevorans TaxID=171404 RepID=A0A2R5ESK5_9BACL|nr:ATP-binding protein [Paenibacillus agaridevorans]GBG06381.1 PAS domain-containing sensor histidine kinase [Paenibacillus agaridevorans]
MSIKAKLSLSISGIVAIILILNIGFSYYTSKLAQEVALESQMRSIAEQLVVSVDSFENVRVQIDIELAEQLRFAALAAKGRLDPDIRNISNDDLINLSKELGLHDITLWQRIDDEIVSVRSSNKEELNLNSSSWDYWNTAFHQLMDLKPVTVKEGLAMEHFYSGPINYAVSNPNEINKWGYYYDGSTNYMINTIVNAQQTTKFNLVDGTNSLVKQLVTFQNSLLEITGFNPDFFGKKKIIKMKKDIPVYNLDVRDIMFGDYTYSHPDEDAVHIQTALKKNEMVFDKFEANGKKVIRSFIPVVTGAPYVIGVAFDEEELMKPLRQQLLVHSLISLGLVLLAMGASYVIAGYMLRSLHEIMSKVNAMSIGNFSDPISIRNKDEIGLLAARVNSMGTNLLKYTTQLKDTANELQSTKQYLESFVNNTSDAIHVVDLDYNIIQVNNAFERMYGWKMDEVLGHPTPNLPDEYASEKLAIMNKVLYGDSVTDYETVHLTKSGERIDVSMTVSAIRDEEEQIVAIATISRNITSRKQAEEMLRRSEKLSIIGQLAAGVAHEVRNPLTTLRGFVQLHKQTGTLSETHLDLMLSELDDINMIVSEFLVLAKPQANQYARVEIVPIIRDIVMIMESEARLNGIMLSYEAEENIPDVFVVGSQIKQVMINLIKNGIEAMPGGGGKLDIRVAPAEKDEVVIQVIDQGYGISEEDLPRLCEPFFTSKSQGYGLGLMVCQQIIDNHKGSLSFCSTLGAGTCVEVRLPAAPPLNTDATASPEDA